MRRRALGGMLAMLLFVTGCMSNLPAERSNEGWPLPEVRPGPEAPTGDSQSARESSVVLYRPDAAGTKLVTSVADIVIAPGQAKEEACVEALLDAVNESDFRTGAQPLRLAVVSGAVESTGNLVTVNLAPSARTLGSQEMSALRVALANTLTELPGKEYVNVLVNGRDTGLNLAGTLPTGVISRYPGGDLSTYLSQVELQRTSEETALQKAVALYFVSEDGASLLGEVRSVAFPRRDGGEYARIILEELSTATQIQGARLLAPPVDYYERDPVFVEVGNASLSYLELHLYPSIDDYLMMRGATRAMLFSSICYTLTSFIPRLDGVVVYIGGEMVTSLELMDGSEWASSTGYMTREDFSHLAADTCTVYFPLADGAGLHAVTRPIAQRLRTQPRALLRELMKPPINATLSPALPEGVTDADVLGLKIEGDTALVNLSAAFAQACRDLDEVWERNMVYAMVNTLTEIDGVQRVRFFVDGKQEALAGHLFMEGEFLRHTGLIR